MIKRMFDLAGSSIALVLLSPILALVSLLVRIKLGAPVLFKQQRPGRDGKPFTLLKFRTMTNERDHTGQLLPTEQRMTKAGRRLRESSLDELPELINVMKGDMSLVGPRPLKMEYLPRYSPRQARRHEVRPGITGWAQVNGRNDLAWEDRFELDVWYVDNHSILLDLRILARTVWTALSARGVHSDDGGIIEPFRGAKPVDQRAPHDG